ncbi:hypothetical protein MSG28_002489 [Choristoneura fumiferana]|nr:hypothetical protein MSG28_002489 [Choristoneura fumiferana]
MLMLVLASVLAAVRADCDACVEGRCYTRKTLARELYIPDQMAIDRKNRILYVHTDSEMNTAFFHEDLTIQLVLRSIMLLLVLASVLAVARADCDACIEGRCYTRKTLARELHIPDQMAIDRKNGILYVHTDSEMNTAFFHEDLTIQLMNDETNKLVEYAAYESGSVDKFVFDKNNNIVFYDSSDGSFNLWKPDLSDSARCTITAPHSKYQITKKPNIDQNCFNH